VQSIPHLNELYQHFQPTGLQVIGVTSEPAAKIQAFVRKKEMNYSVAIDEGGELSAAYGIRGIPHALLVNAQGVVVWRGHPGKLTVSFIEEKLIANAALSPKPGNL
jgi:peroxiredoxin